MWNHRFAAHTVISLHVRAGNGETGDFEIKRRGIGNLQRYVSNIENLLDLHREQHKLSKPMLLFLVTYTPLVREMIAIDMQQYDMTVVVYPHAFETSGVTSEVRSSDCCLRGWES